jgi:type III pantothenate kinase
VNPAGIKRVLAEWPTSVWSPPRVVRRASELPVAVRVDAPDRVGLDRLLNALAVNQIRGEDRPAVVVSSGTATTIDLVTADGAFAGGAILPGLELCSRSLHQETALLPLVPMEDLAQPGVPVVGRNTQEAIRSGLLYGQVGAIREIVGRISASLERLPFVVLTGGNGPLLAPYFESTVQVEQELALRGLAIAAPAVALGQIEPGGM